MTDLEELIMLSDSAINSAARDLSIELKQGNMMITSNRLSNILGCTPELLKNAIREQKVGFGMCHRSENSKSWTTSAYIPLVGKWLSQYETRKNPV